jgi:hypothetical protein
MGPPRGRCFYGRLGVFFFFRWKGDAAGDHLGLAVLSGGTRRSELVWLRSQVLVYGYLLVEKATDRHQRHLLRHDSHPWQGLFEVVGCIVSITPVGSAVQPANFPRPEPFRPDNSRRSSL